ncbi:MAG: hypothetical protein J5J06_05935 [Phycisphaerae bacterium]|nr:hypothetical protein [Phycisphaerae bacterium]
MPDEPKSPSPGDQNRPDQAPEPSEGGEQDLDALLAQAAALVDEVSSDLGRVDAGGAERDSLSDLDAVGGESTTEAVERQIGEVDELLGQTRQALGPSSTKSHTGKLDANLGDPLEAPSDSPSSGDEIPDFMSEFTRSAEPADPLQEDKRGIGRPVTEGVQETTDHDGIESIADQSRSTPGGVESDPGEESAARDPKPGPKSGVGRISSFSKPPEPIDPEAMFDDDSIPSIEEEGEVTAGGDGASEGTEERAAGGSAKRVLLRSAEGLAHSAANAGVSLVEWVDRPLARSGDRVREIVGLCALATAATAVILLIVSLFR